VIRRTREQIAADVWRLSLPYPNGLVNSYLLLDGDGARLIDAGYPTDACRDHLQTHFDELGVRVEDLREILITHSHPDHVGLVWELAERSGAGVLLHEAEADVPGGATPRVDRGWLVDQGLPEELLLAPNAPFRLPPPERLLRGDECLRFGPLSLRLLWTPGHSPGLLCAWEPERRLLFTSDHLLRSPTPLFQYTGGPEDPVGEYLDGLDRLAACDPGLVLPGHGRAFADFQGALEAARAAQRERLEVVDGLRSGGRSAWEIARATGWMDQDRPDGDPRLVATFGFGRTLAYLRHLEGMDGNRA
jgi:glyoxylase-like metal-dependent hydrolase (beta-lactamase superfamily II)